MPSRLWFVLLLAIGPAGCLVKLSRMAKEEAHYALDCPREQLKVAVTLTTPPYTLYTVKGCDQFVRYRATCESMRSGCDAANKHPECDGTCRLIDREEMGTVGGEK